MTDEPADFEQDDGTTNWQPITRPIGPAEIGSGRPFVARTEGIRRLFSLEDDLTTSVECEWKAVPSQEVWWPLRPLPIAVENFFSLHAHLTMLADARYPEENAELVESSCERLIAVTFVRAFIVKAPTVSEVARWSDLTPSPAGVTFCGKRAPTFTQAFFRILTDQLRASDGLLGGYPDEVLEWLENDSSIRPRLDDRFPAYLNWLGRNPEWDFRDQKASVNHLPAELRKAADPSDLVTAKQISDHMGCNDDTFKKRTRGENPELCEAIEKPDGNQPWKWSYSQLLSGDGGRFQSIKVIFSSVDWPDDPRMLRKRD